MKNKLKMMEKKLEEVLGNGGLFITLTYQDTLPEKVTAKRDLLKFIFRLKHLRKKNELPAMKYVAVTELTDIKVHHHLVINAVNDSFLEEMKKMWEPGKIVFSQIGPGKDYLCMAKYITKENVNGQPKRLITSRTPKEN